MCFLHQAELCLFKNTQQRGTNEMVGYLLGICLAFEENWRMKLTVNSQPDGRHRTRRLFWMDSERHYIGHAALQIRSLRDIATITSFSKMNSRRTDDNTTYKEPLLFFFFFLILPWVFQHGGNWIDSYCEIRTKNLAIWLLPLVCPSELTVTGRWIRSHFSLG